MDPFFARKSAESSSNKEGTQVQLIEFGETGMMGWSFVLDFVQDLKMDS